MKLKVTTLIALFIAVSISTYAQNFIFSQNEKDKDGNTFFVQVSNNVTNSAANEIELLNGIAYNTALQFKLTQSILDNAGYTHNAYSVYFKDIKILGADYVVHSKNGVIKYANGLLPKIEPDFSTKSAISETKAIGIAVEAESASQNNVKIKFEITQPTKSELLIDYYQDKALLVYKVVLSATQYFVSAIDGKITRTVSLICTDKHVENAPPPNAPGTAQTLYSGTQTGTINGMSNFVTDAFNGSFRLREIRNNVNIITRNLHGHDIEEPSVTNFATDFTDNDNNWQLGEHGIDAAAHDVHWASERVLDYWGTVHNRNSINGNGLAINNYVHCLIAGSPINAAWFLNSMWYGDGGGSINPLVSLDITSHEFGHGITQYTVPGGGLTPGSAQSGALNEGFSDIWGASVEAWSDPNKQRWLMGEELFRGTGFNCIRNMQNPKSLLALEGQHPDTYLGEFWDVAGEPHNNSTVLSHWYFLLTQGGSGTNDLGNTFNVSGVGINKAEKIAYRTEQLLNSSANYAMARTMSIQAATELYGANSCEVIAVIRAWYAVGVGADYSGAGSFLINGNNAICATHTGQYSISPANANTVWSVSGIAGATVSPATGTTTTVTVPASATSGSFLLTATIPGGCQLAFSRQIRLSNGTGPNQYSYTPYITQGGNTTYMSNFCNHLTYLCTNTMLLL